MRHFLTLCDFDGRRHGLVHRQRTLGNSLLERVALIVGHDNEETPLIGFIDVVDVTDVAMLEG